MAIYCLFLQKSNVFRRLAAFVLNMSECFNQKSTRATCRVIHLVAKLRVYQINYQLQAFRAVDKQMPLEYVTAMVVLFNQLRKNDAVNILKHLLWSKITKALPAVCAIKYSLLSITLTILFNLADEFKEHQIGKFCESLYSFPDALFTKQSIRF